MTRSKLTLCIATLSGAAASHALAQSDDPANGYTMEVGVIALSTDASGAISVSGSGEMIVPRIHARSTNAAAIIGSGNGTLRTRCVHSAGGTEFGNSVDVTGLILEDAGVIEHPFEEFVMPEMADMSADQGSLRLKNGNFVVSPGYYSGGIEVQTNANVTFEPGEYYLGGSGFMARTGTVMADGVVLILMDGELDMSGNADVYISPPESGDYQGIALVQHSSNTNAMKFRGGAGFYIGGTIFAPSAHVDVRGNSGILGSEPFFGDLLVANTIEVGGNGVLRIGMWRPAGNLPVAALWD